MSNYSDFDDSPPPSPPPEQDNEFQYENDDNDDFPPPPDEFDNDEEDPPLSINDDYDENDIDSSLPPPSEEDFDGPNPEESIDEEFPPPSEDLDEPPPSTYSNDDLSPPPSSIGDPPASVDVFPRSNRDGPFILPVRALQMNSQSDQVDENAAIDGDIDSLSAGLVIKKAPAIIKSSIPVDDGQRSQKNAEKVSSSNYIEQSKIDVSGKKASIHGMEAFDNQESLAGYTWCLGKFEGDPFEKLQVKIDGLMLYARVATGETIDFDLSTKSFIFEDTADVRTLILDYRKTPVLLRFFSDDDYFEFMKALPEVVFIAQDEIEESVSAKSIPSVKVDKKTVSNSKSLSISKPVSRLQNQHVKGTSVEDILENDLETPFIQKAAQSTLPTNQIIVPPGPPRKKELADSHIRRPKYSVRRVSLLCEWINTLHIWPNAVTILTLHKEMVNGILLTKLVKVLNPEVQFVHLNEKALAKKSAIENLEQALGHIWRSKSLNNSRIPSAEDIYNGDVSKIAVLLNELFGVYVQRPLFKNAVKVLRWFHHILKQYQRPLPSFVLEEGDLSGMWPHFQSGTALFCVLYHFFGSTSVGKAGEERRLDPLRIAGDPKSICDFRDNLRYVFDTLHLIGVEVLWTPEDWITNPDTEFILLQLSFIYDKLKLYQCALPPAQGDRPGLTSGPNGEALVVGLVFNDAPSSLKYVSRAKKAVRLGYDGDSMPLLPIDQPLKNSRFFSHGIIPRGMITKDANVGFVGLKLKEAKVYSDKGQWNARTALSTEKEVLDGSQVVGLLRSHHRRGDVKDAKNVPSKSSSGTVRSSNFLQSSVRPNQDASSESKDRSVFSYDEYGKDIATLIKTLEDEMIAAQKEIQSAEDTLASRYIDLEASASSFSPEEYSRSLDQLETERVDLEDEKDRLKDYFARKLALIKERKEEVHKKAVDLKKSVTQLNLAASEQVETANKKSKEEASLKRSTKSSTQKDVKQVEKGWIKLSSKMETHNFHLRHKQEVASAAFQAKITPKRLLEKHGSMSQQTSGRGQQDSSGSSTMQSQMHEKSRSNLTPEQLVADSFQRFKDRLKVASGKWLQSRNMRTRSVVQEIIQSGVKNPTVELISLPDKSVHGNAQGHVHLPTSSHNYSSPQLRMEELAAMYYEDERRKMVLSEHDIIRSLEQTQKLFITAPASNEAPFNAPPQSPRSGGKSMFATTSLNASEMENILRYLIQPQILTICGRNPREYVFELIEVEGGENRASNEDMMHSFSWSWRDPYSVSSGDQGSLLLVDINQVVATSYDDNSLQIIITESGRALKNSKGRTHLQLLCSSPSERDKLVYAFSYVLHAFHTK